jgi:hypothetical protein
MYSGAGCINSTYVLAVHAEAQQDTNLGAGSTKLRADNT